MKKIIKHIFLCIICFTAFSEAVFSQIPEYTLTATNVRRPAPDSLTFDILLVHTNPGVAPYQYSAAQYFFRFNSAIANGGTLRYRIIGSDLPSGSLPQNPTVTGNELRLASNLPVPQGSAINVSATAPGTLVARMSLKTSASSFAPGEPFNLRWRNANDPPFYTKLSAYVGMFIQDITDSAGHSVDTTTISVNQISSIVPVEYRIFQNYPNPFNPSTNIKFDIPKSSVTKLTVFNITGKELGVLLNEKLEAGSYEYNWNASQYSSGVYFYRVESGNFTATKRMLLIK